MRNGIGLGVEERITSLFQPDILIFAQYFATFRYKVQLEPEKRLLLAVLEDAVACFQNYLLAHDKKGKEMFREAEDWIREQNSDWPFSFENICETLGFDPEYVRQGLFCWKVSRLANHFPAQRKKRCEVLLNDLSRTSLHAAFRTRGRIET